MSLLNWLGSLDGRQRMALIAVVALVLTAGCLGLGDSGGEDPEMDNESSVDDPGEDQTDDDDSDDDGDQSDGDDSPVSESVDAWLEQFEGIEEPADDVSVETLVSETVANLESVESYEYTRSTEVFDETPQQQVQTSTTQDSAVDVSNREASFTRTTDSAQRSTEFEGYLSNGTLYQRNEQYEQQYGTAWIQQDVGEDYENIFAQIHVIGALTDTMENSSATLYGTAEVNGETAHVVQLNVSEYLLGQTGGQTGSTSVEESQMLVWISDSSNELLRAASYSQLTRTASGQEVDSTIENNDTFEYVPVDVTVPEDAQNGTVIDN